MRTTHNKAIEIAKTGNWDKAWNVAQQDEGLNPGVTKEQWIAFAEKCIARRAEEKRTEKYAPEYSF